MGKSGLTLCAVGVDHVTYMWVYKGGPPDQPVISFQYSPNRSGEIPLHYLFRGEDASRENQFYSVTDGYSGYNELSKRPEVIDRAGCWAYVRRKFVDATHGRNEVTPNFRTAT